MHRRLLGLFMIGLLAVCGGCEDILSSFTEKSAQPVDGVGDMVGYGPVTFWYDVDADLLGDALLENGLTITQIEFFNDAFFGDLNTVKPHFNEFIGKMRQRNILVSVNIINWNYRSIGDPQYDTTWFNAIMDYFVDEVGPEGIILQAASEWDASRNLDSTDKALAFNDILAERWPGMKSWNRGAHPSSAPAGFLLEYHAHSTGDIGPQGGITTTDSSSILQELSLSGNVPGPVNTALLKDYARRVHAAGNGFIYYDFANPTINFDVIGALGEMLRE
ncbi:MAG: hypothetical protein HY343_10385 [Lentisphaerae bacterium]|nr:hypothetical protein [Lentisphaerota bacterium]